MLRFDLILSIFYATCISLQYDCKQLANERISGDALYCTCKLGQPNFLRGFWFQTPLPLPKTDCKTFGALGQRFTTTREH